MVTSKKGRQMERKEAIKTIKEAESCFCKHGAYKDCHSGCKYREALDAAVKALEQEPTAKNDLGVDCVSRADALDCVNWGYSFSDIYKKINELPSVTPQEPRIITCKECKYYRDKGNKYSYCTKRLNVDSVTDRYREPNFYCADAVLREVKE